MLSSHDLVIRMLRSFFHCNLLLLIDMNEWNNNECAKFISPHPNIRNKFTRSHRSKLENRVMNQ